MPTSVSRTFAPPRMTRNLHDQLWAIEDVRYGRVGNWACLNTSLTAAVSKLELPGCSSLRLVAFQLVDCDQLQPKPNIIITNTDRDTIGVD
jgi:hypothetical protein